MKTKSLAEVRSNHERNLEDKGFALLNLGDVLADPYRTAHEVKQARSWASDAVKRADASRVELQRAQGAL